MPQALPLQTKISQATAGDTEFKVLEAKYGNGCAQRAGDGYNNVVTSWNVTWENISSSDFNTIVAAFNSAAGVDYFTWQPEGDTTTKKFVVTKYQRSVKSGSVYSVSATLTEDFSL